MAARSGCRGRGARRPAPACTSSRPAASTSTAALPACLPSHTCRLVARLPAHICRLLACLPACAGAGTGTARRAASRRWPWESATSRCCRWAWVGWVGLCGGPCRVGRWRRSSGQPGVRRLGAKREAALRRGIHAAVPLPPAFLTRPPSVARSCLPTAAVQRVLQTSPAAWGVRARVTAWELLAASHLGAAACRPAAAAAPSCHEPSRVLARWLLQSAPAHTAPIPGRMPRTPPQASR